MYNFYLKVTVKKERESHNVGENISKSYTIHNVKQTLTSLHFCPSRPYTHSLYYSLEQKDTMGLEHHSENLVNEKNRTNLNFIK